MGALGSRSGTPPGYEEKRNSFLQTQRNATLKPPRLVSLPPCLLGAPTTAVKSTRRAGPWTQLLASPPTHPKRARRAPEEQPRFGTGRLGQLQGPGRAGPPTARARAQAGAGPADPTGVRGEGGQSQRFRGAASPPVWATRALQTREKATLLPQRNEKATPRFLAWCPGCCLIIPATCLTLAASRHARSRRPRLSAHVWVSSIKHEAWVWVVVCFVFFFLNIYIFIFKQTRFPRCLFLSSLPSIHPKAAHVSLLPCKSLRGLHARVLLHLPPITVVKS